MASQRERQDSFRGDPTRSLAGHRTTLLRSERPAGCQIVQQLMERYEDKQCDARIPHSVGAASPALTAASDAEGLQDDHAHQGGHHQDAQEGAVEQPLLGDGPGPVATPFGQACRAGAVSPKKICTGALRVVTWALTSIGRSSSAVDPPGWLAWRSPNVPEWDRRDRSGPCQLDPDASIGTNSRPTSSARRVWRRGAGRRRRSVAVRLPRRQTVRRRRAARR
jgi:hypothetical protein